MKALAILLLSAALAAPAPVLAAEAGGSGSGATGVPSRATAETTRSLDVSPALDFAPPRPEPRPVTRQWWFWTAVGAVVVGTAAVLVLSHKAPQPPSSTLGDQEFAP